MNNPTIIVTSILSNLIKLRTSLHDALTATTSRSILDPEYAKRKIQINDKISDDYNKGVETLNAAIDNLSKIQYSSDLNIIHILKFLSLIRVPNLKIIEFTYDYKIVNHETLLDIEYPLDLVPEDFTCKILNVVMSRPCDIPGAAIIDRVIVEKSPQNPFNRQPWPDVIPILSSLQESINLFMRKVEWLYVYFQEGKKYKKAYVHSDINSWVLDSNITYVDFAKLVKELPENSLDATDGIQNPETNFVIYGLDKQPAYPVKYIYTIFFCNIKCLFLLDQEIRIMKS